MTTTFDIQTSEMQPFIILPTFINGIGPFSFVLDTGANLAIITEELAKDLILQNTETKEGLGAGGKRIKVKLGEVSSFSVGSAKIENAKVGVMQTLPKCIGQGVVGYDFLKHYVLIIDYIENKFYLTPPEEYRDDKYTQTGIIPFKISRQDRPLILVNTIINSQKTYQFILDTGASFTVISPTLAYEMGVTGTMDDTLIGASGAVRSSSAIINTLSIDNTSITNVSVMIANAFSQLNEVIGTVIDGIIGYNILREFRIIINYPKETLRFFKLAKVKTVTS